MNRQQSIMITVRPPYAQMVMNGYIDFIFKNQLLENMNIEIDHEPVIVCVCESTDDGGTGKVIGSVQLKRVYRPFYTQSRPSDITLIKERLYLIKAMYYSWCEKNEITPNHNEGWFSSKRFRQYQEHIGFLNNLPDYALCVENPIPYMVPVTVHEFSDETGAPLTCIPQNMCVVYR